MSDSQEESIYQLIPREAVAPPKAPMHRSKFPPTVPPTGSTFGSTNTSKTVANLGGSLSEPMGGAHQYKKDTATFGKPLGTLKPSTSNPLKKGGTAASLVPTQTYEKLKRKPTVPRADERPLMGLETTKNFVTANAVENILAVAKKPKQPAAPYVTKEDYGQVPEYLVKIKDDINAEYDFIRQMQERQEEEKRSNVRVLSDEERDALVAGLKAKWEKVNREYQGMTHVVQLDTIGKVRRKERYELTLAQIEKDLERINKKYIFVDTTA